MTMTRSRFLRATAAAMAGAAASSFSAAHDVLPAPRLRTRPIPSSGAALPVIGCGTWMTFDVGSSPAERAPLAATLRSFFDAGGSLIDSSPMYGQSEQVVGDLLIAAKSRERAFVATKVWTRGREAGIAQMQNSMQKLGTDRIDLMQVHNLVDWREHLPTLREWKAAGRIRYIGITHYTRGAYAEVEAVMRAEKLDFVQINYAIDDRAAEERILPLAADRGIAVLINRPFSAGALFRKVRDTPLPAWASELECTSWAQLFLKFVLSHPAVTCAVPGMSSAAHVADNIAAGTGTLPDARQRLRIAGLWDAR